MTLIDKEKLEAFDIIKDLVDDWMKKLELPKDEKVKLKMVLSTYEFGLLRVIDQILNPPKPLTAQAKKEAEEIAAMEEAIKDEENKPCEDCRRIGGSHDPNCINFEPNENYDD